MRAFRIKLYYSPSQYHYSTLFFYVQAECRSSAILQAKKEYPEYEVVETEEISLKQYYTDAFQCTAALMGLAGGINGYNPKQ